MIVKELFSNLAILISLIFIYMQFITVPWIKKANKLTKKIILGIIGGLLCNILMQYSVHFFTTIIDLRHIPILLVAYYGGGIPAILSMILVIIGRLIIGINISAYSGVVFTIFTTVTSLYISKKQISKFSKIILVLSSSNIFFSILAFYLITDKDTLILLIPAYWGSSYLAGFIAFYVVEYLQKTSELFNKYKFESATDVLTGLKNIREFDETFDTLIKNAENKKNEISLLYIDIDFFKKINDTYGHSAGDIVLKDLGNILKSSTRPFDVVSRKGGEEFIVVLLDCSLEGAIKISEYIRKNVEDYPFILNSGQTIHTTVSIGVSCFHTTTKEPHLLIEDADKALYTAKRTGRNKVCVFNG